MTVELHSVEEVRFETDDARPGGDPASGASVRDQGPRECGERSRVNSSRSLNWTSAWGRVSPPAKNHRGSARLRKQAKTPGNQSSVTPAPNLNAGVTAPLPPKATSSCPAVVGRRVDALVIAFQVALSPAARDELRERQAIADEYGLAELRLETQCFALRRSRRLNCVPFENADVRCMFDEQGPGGWNLEVVVRAAFLATHPLSTAVRLATEVALALGTIVATRLRRVDLCADFVGFPLRRDDSERIASRARHDVFIGESKDSDEASAELCKPRVREHHKANLEVTGFTVAPGNPLMARIYDKTAELRLSGREEKRLIEYANWSTNGWNEADDVTRIEFQLRGEILDELRLRDVQSLEQRLDAVWQTCVNCFRFGQPDSATRRSRCKLDERWQAVQAVQFAHHASPIKRARIRGGASAEHAMGALISRLASTSRLRRINLVSPDGEVFSSERNFAASMSEGEATEFVLTYARSRCDAFAIEFAETITTKLRPHAAVARLVARHNGTVSRHDTHNSQEQE